MIKRMFQRQRLIGCVWIVVALTVCAQDSAPERIVVPLTDPSRPSRVKLSVLNGSITVKGHQRDDVIIEADHRALKIEESDNEVTVAPEGSRPVDLRVAVPVKTSLQLKCTKGGNILVEMVEGEIEADGVNCSITLRKIAGVVVAHSMQGRILVQMDRVTRGKPMSFSTMNGDIDVSLPADTKANVRLQTLNGTIHSDFDVVQKPDSRHSAGQRLSGSINGGGPHIQLKTLNGGVHLRKPERNTP
jgi:DUF4097 and DUF4098 domain-containing protein YvlB